MEQRTRPLTDPADLFRLLGRFTCALFLSALTVVYIVKRDMPGILFFAVASIIAQGATLRLWKKLVAERQAAIAEGGEGKP
jgi:hypothetical protein